MGLELFNSDYFISYVKFRNVLLINKSEWAALFVHCYRGGALNLLPEDEKRIHKYENLLCTPEVSCIDGVTLSGFVKYVEKRNINLLPKSEWQQVFFYYFVTEYKKPSICNLSTRDIYDLCDFFKLDYSDISILIKKSNKYDNLEDDINFVQFINTYLKETAFNIESGYLSFEVINPRVKEKLQRLLRKNSIFHDSSFNKDIVKLSDKDFTKLINADNEEYKIRLTEKAKLYIQQNFRVNRKSKTDSDYAKEVFEEIEMQSFSKAISVIFDKLTGSLSLNDFKTFVSFFTKK